MKPVVKLHKGKMHHMGGYQSSSLPVNPAMSTISDKSSSTTTLLAIPVSTTTPSTIIGAPPPVESPVKLLGGSKLKK
jgi:hypothetical protein